MSCLSHRLSKCLAVCLLSAYLSLPSALFFFCFVLAIMQIGPQLVSLKLSRARIIRDDTFRDMVRTFESMRYLSLDGTFYVKSQAINALAKAGQQLQEVRSTCLRWRWCWFTFCLGVKCSCCSAGLVCVSYLLQGIGNRNRNGGVAPFSHLHSDPLPHYSNALGTLLLAEGRDV